MKKILQAIATIVLLGAVVFLGGEWPENTKLVKVILCDCGAFVLIALSSIYLRASGAFKREGE